MNSPPGEPEGAVTETPADVPCNACAASIGLKSSNVSALTIDTAPVTSFFFCVP